MGFPDLSLGSPQGIWVSLQTSDLEKLVHLAMGRYNYQNIRLHIEFQKLDLPGPCTLFQETKLGRHGHTKLGGLAFLLAAVLGTAHLDVVRIH